MTLTTVRPRPVLCVNEHEHRDRELADATADGVFSFAGETRALGLEPDWLRAELPDDEEWRIDWVKFYYGLDLADAFRATGDRRYLEAWERLVASFILQVPPDHDSSDVTARRILNWIYAWQRLPEANVAGLVESLRAQARHVRDNLTAERNHRTLELYALLIAALALPDLEPGLLELATRELHTNLLTDFGSDGVHRERSTHYHMIALRSFVGARENCRRFGVALTREFDERLSRACGFALHMQRPDGTIPALSDSDTADYAELLELAARLLARDELRRRPVGHASFGDGGYFVQRAGDRYLIFDCGPLGDGGHGHYDALSIEAWAGDRALVLDPGRFTYAAGGARSASGLAPAACGEPEPDLRHWFRGTAAHNTVTVDGTDQTPYARSRSSLPSAEATFLGRETRDRLDILTGEVRSPVYEAVHRRRVILVDGAYWVIEDRLTGERRHRYDLRFHLAPARFDGAVTLTITGARGIASEEGWISPEYGVREPRAETMAEVISQRLLGGVPVERCERTYVKYRFGDSLRAVYRFDGRYVALRSGKRDGIAAPEVGAALYPFPHDRKLTALRDAPLVIERLLGGAATPQLVAYAAEQSATFACRARAGNVLAYAKVQRGEGERRGCKALAGQDAVRVPRLIAAADGVLLLEPIHGRRLDDLHGLGTSLAALHNLNELKGDSPLNVPFRRLEVARLATAADMIAQARPDVAGAAERLLALLIERGADAVRAPVLLHGDANLRNALLLEDGSVALLDLEHLSVGPAAADLGQVLANLIVARTPQAATALLEGYKHPPDKRALRWYTAASLLARVALPAISRYRPDALARLRELLDAGAALLALAA